MYPTAQIWVFFFKGGAGAQKIPTTIKHGRCSSCSIIPAHRMARLYGNTEHLQHVLAHASDIITGSKATPETLAGTRDTSPYFLRKLVFTVCVKMCGHHQRPATALLLLQPTCTSPTSLQLVLDLADTSSPRYITAWPAAAKISLPCWRKEEDSFGPPTNPSTSEFCRIFSSSVLLQEAADIRLMIHTASEGRAGGQCAADQGGRGQSAPPQLPHVLEDKGQLPGAPSHPLPAHGAHTATGRIKIICKASRALAL